MTPYPKKQPRRAKAPDGSFSRGTVLAIWDRDGGKCAWCGQVASQDFGLMPWQTQVHHRWPRGMGGTSEAFVGRPSNGVLLHAECHTYIEAHRDEAIGKGFLIVHGIEKPRAVPIEHAVLGRVRLRDDGTYDREMFS